jgi:hypothetical protein
MEPHTRNRLGCTLIYLSKYGKGVHTRYVERRDGGQSIASNASKLPHVPTHRLLAALYGGINTRASVDTYFRVASSMRHAIIMDTDSARRLVKTTVMPALKGCFVVGLTYAADGSYRLGFYDKMMMSDDPDKAFYEQLVSACPKDGLAQLGEAYGDV